MSTVARSPTTAGDHGWVGTCANRRPTKPQASAREERSRGLGWPV